MNSLYIQLKFFKLYTDEESILKLFLKLLAY